MRVKGELEENEARDRLDSWQSRIIEECNRAISRDNPVQGLFDVWMLCRRALNYFETDDSAAVLGESQPIVVDAVRRVHDRIETIAAYHLKEGNFQRMKKKVIERAKANPIRGTFPEEPPFSDTDPGEDVLKFLLDLGTMPLRAVADLTKALGSLVYRLPGVDQSGGAQAILEHLDKSRPEWHATVVKVQETAKSIENTVAGAPEAAGALEAAAEAIGRAKKEIGTLWSTSDGWGESVSSDERERFRLQEVTDTAEAVTETVGELR